LNAVGERLLLAAGNFREAVRIQQGDSSAIDGEQLLIPKYAEQANGGFNRDAGHLGHLFPLEREPDPDMIVVYFPESIAEVQQQAGEPLAGRLEGELIEMIHIDSHFIAEELDQLDRQLRISADNLEITFFVDDADLRRLQCLARHFMKGPIPEDVFLDQLTGTQDPDDLPLASRRRTSQFDLARAEHIEAQTYMAFIKDGLMRRVIEGAFDFLKFGEVVSFNVAQHDLRAKPAGIAMLDVTGLPFHDLPILVPTRQFVMEHDSKQRKPA
jgi:hypothetical protein